MTEEEAKTKWCFVRFSEKAADTSRDQLCIGSRCMAWRWHTEYKPIGRSMVGYGETSSVNGACGLLHP